MNDDSQSDKTVLKNKLMMQLLILLYYPTHSFLNCPSVDVKLIITVGGEVHTEGMYHCTILTMY